MAIKFLNEIEHFSKPIIEDLGYELYYLEYVKENGNHILRYYIDSINGIDLNDCEKVSRSLSDILDEKDVIKDSYYLEVSSPGIERTLHNDEHLKKFIDSDIKIKLKSSFENKKIFIGILKDFNEDNIIILNENKELKIPKNKIKEVNLYDNSLGGNKIE